jgi:RimJ/RimL family protein N-acetyltransferase
MTDRGSLDQIETARLVLEPLRIDHAAGMVEVLADPELYAYTGGTPPTSAELEERYARQTTENPAWRNWIVHTDREPVGYVQADVTDGDAVLAWVIGTPWQGRGYATEAAAAVMKALSPRHFSALIGPENVPSQHVAARLGLRPTDEVVDGETRWRT